MIHFSVLTNANNQTLNKSIGLNDQGKLIKDHPNPMSGGRIDHVKKELTELPELLGKMGPSNALVHGVVKGSIPGDSHKVVSARKYRDGVPPGTTARSKECISYADKALSMLDIDPDSQNPESYMTPDLITEVFASIDPQWNNIGHVVVPSTGSYLFLDGNPITANSPGYHLYFAADNAGQLTEYMAAVFKLTVIAGHGWIKFAANGAMLLRSCFDGAVFSPERIDFTAAPTIIAPRITQARPAPEHFPGIALDCSKIPEVNEDEFKQIVRVLKGELETVAKSEKITATRVNDISQQRRISIEAARDIVKAQLKGDLQPDDVILFREFGEVTVKEIISNLQKYDRVECCDPAEPELGTGKAMLYANQSRGKEKPMLHSQLHGGCDYFLHGETKINPTEILRGYEVTKEYTSGLGKEEFLFKNLLIKQHILTIIAESGGGKTTFLYFHVARELAKSGLTVWYVDADSPASDHKMMKQFADDHGIKFLIPDVNQGKSVQSLMQDITKLAESHVELDGYVFFFDTLKKFIDLMSKKSAKDFFVLMRRLTKLGATVVLPGHANKHRDVDGNLVFEGVGDIKSDSDDLIFFEKTKKPDGSMDVTTVIDSDRGAKVRGLFKPFSFHIDQDRSISFHDNPLQLIDLSNIGLPKATNEEILDTAEQYLKSRAEAVGQTQLVEYTADKVEGEAGKKRVRKLIVQHSVLEGDTGLSGVRFVYTIGKRNAHFYELSKPMPNQPILFDESSFTPPS